MYYKNNIPDTATVLADLAVIIGNGKELQHDSSVIQFDEWATMTNASEHWCKFLTDVIKPLKKKDFEFIFQLGDVTTKHGFEIDEVFDIFGDYSSYGRVTLVLDNNEADKLFGIPKTWKAPQGDAKEKYLFLFNNMGVDVLVILFNNRVMLFSRDGHFEFAGQLPDKTLFNNGYRLGLSLRLDLPYCVALGLAVSGASQQQKNIQDYINDWITSLPHKTEIS